ncbi:MAG: tRNA (cytidine/uridine-2'-O-)-methyltransferase [Kiritimatiellia bacterium]
MTPPLHIALLHPEIPGNTGNIGRLCVGVGAALHLVHPLGFDTSDKAVRRAGLDYWRDVHVVEHASAEHFWEWIEGRPVVALTARAERSYVHAPYTEGTVLLFGRETKGLPAEVVQRFGGWSIPAPGPVRSLNLSNAVAVVAYHALQTVRPAWFST